MLEHVAGMLEDVWLNLFTGYTCNIVEPTDIIERYKM